MTEPLTPEREREIRRNASSPVGDRRDLNDALAELDRVRARCAELEAAVETAFDVIERMEEHHRWHHAREGRDVESDEHVFEGIVKMQEALDAT